MSPRYLIVVTALAAIPVSVVGGIVTALPAAADCVGTGTSTVCAQGTVRGGGPAGGASYPSTCYNDWYCDDAWDLDVNLGPIRPGGPGGPGRPGRPGGGGGIGPR